MKLKYQVYQIDQRHNFKGTTDVINGTFSQFTHMA